MNFEYNDMKKLPILKGINDYQEWKGMFIARLDLEDLTDYVDGTKQYPVIRESDLDIDDEEEEVEITSATTSTSTTTPSKPQALSKKVKERNRTIAKDLREREAELAVKIDKWKSSNRKALGLLKFSVHTTILPVIEGQNVASEAWKILASRYTTNSEVEINIILRQLYSSNLQDHQVEEYIAKWDKNLTRLKVLGDDFSEKKAGGAFLLSLDENIYKAFRTYRLEKDDNTFSNVSNLLLLSESGEKATKEMAKLNPVVNFTQRNQTSNQTSNTSSNTSSNNNHSSNVSQSQPEVICSNCNKPNHTKEKCWSKGGDKEGEGFWQKKGKNKVNAAQTLNETQSNATSTLHVYQPDPNESDNSAGLITLPSSNSATISTTRFIADSGATIHLTPNQVPNPKLLNPPIKINLAGKNQTIHANSKSTFNFAGFKLKDVLHSDEAAESLLSLHQLAKEGNTIVLDNRGGFITKKSDKEVDDFGGNGTRLSKEGSNWILEDEASVFRIGKKISLYDLHSRLGHISRTRIIDLVKNHSVGFKLEDISDVENPIRCDSCSRAKSIKQPRSGVPSQTTEPLALVHSDLSGKFDVETLGGFYYYITFIDDFSRFTWIKLIKSKSEAFNAFVEFQSKVENQFNKKIKKIRTDRGGEYNSIEFRNTLAKDGIIHSETNPRSPSENGVAERANRTLKELASAMLLQSNLPKTFFGLAILHAVHIKNIAPSKSITSTPYEMLYKKQPDLSREHPFGCIAFRHLPEEDRSAGISTSRAERGQYLGRSERSEIGSKVLITGENGSKVVKESRDVTFIDEEFELKLKKKAYSREEGALESDSDSESEDIGEEDIEEEGEPLRRSTRRRKIPENHYFVRRATIIDEPRTYHQAINSPNSNQWVIAIEAELESLAEAKTWKVVERPLNDPVLNSKWVFVKKFDLDGNLSKRKARVVAIGYSQRPGVDFDETYAPTAYLQDLRLLLAAAAIHDWDILQYDVKSAFLHGTLNHTIYMELPKGSKEAEIGENGKIKVAKLLKALYGLKQSPRVWWELLDSSLIELGFTRHQSDWGIYSILNEKGRVVIYLHVDDFLALKEGILWSSILEVLGSRFKLTGGGEVEYFLGMEIRRDREKRQIFVSNTNYSISVLNRFKLLECNLVNLPMQPGLNLSDVHTPLSIKVEEYQAIIGSLRWLELSSRPDISYAVGILSRYTTSPKEEHYQAAKRLLRYLKGTIGLGITLGLDENGKALFRGFVDADFANDMQDRSSRSGFVFIYGGAISWSSVKQNLVARSTVEAEYYALSDGASEGKALLSTISALQLHNNHRKEPLSLNLSPTDLELELFTDSQGARDLALNPIHRRKTKHIDVSYHWIRQWIYDRSITLTRIPSTDNPADIFTKPLNITLFKIHVAKMGMKKIKVLDDDGAGGGAKVRV